MVTNPSAEISAPGAPATGDLGPLAWVLDETRKSIETATKSLKRYVHEAESARGVDLASVDASQLRMARQHLHQVAGALDMVGQLVPAHMVRGMEGAVQQFAQHPEKCSEAAAQTLERAGFALIEYLESQLDERPRAALGLFPQFRQVQEMAGADRIHPADLWVFPWRWIDPVTPMAAQPLAYAADVRVRLDQRVLKIMRHADVNAAAEMSVISLGLAQGEAARQPAIFWKLCAAFFEAMASALIPIDVYAKRAASRILLQYASLTRGDKNVSERLAQDLLFFCACAQPSSAAQTPVVDAVRRAWALQRYPAARYDEPAFGLYDPTVLTQGRRRIEAVKENWSALAGGDMARVKACVDQFGLVAESLDKLHEQGGPLGAALNHVARQTAQSGKPPSPELAMETATAVLFLEASFADFHPADPTLATRMQLLAERLDAVRGGAAAAPLEPWMEELYRSVSDRQTMGSVVGELRVTLGEVEQHLDQFFRKPDNKDALASIPGLMGQMRGVLSVLGLEQAALAVGRMRETVEEFLADGHDPEQARAAGTFERLGNSLGALGFQIDMLNYQPMLARKLFLYDAESGELRYVAGRVGLGDAVAGADDGVGGVDLLLELDTPASPPARLGASALLDSSLPPETIPGQLDQIATMAALEDKPALAMAAQRAAEAARQDDVSGLSSALDALHAAAGAPSSPSEPVDSPAAPSAADALLSDDDLLSIFLEEAREVVQAGGDALQALAADPADMAQQTTLRRAFHTLKGSSRMVGLADFGEAAWSMEQLMNAWLAESKPVSDNLRAVAGEAMTRFGDWVEDIAAGRDAAWSSAPFTAAADALRLKGERIPLALGVVQAVDAVTLEADAFATSAEGAAGSAEIAGHAAAPAAEGLSPLAGFDLPDLDLTVPEGEAPPVLSDSAKGDAGVVAEPLEGVDLIELDLSDAGWTGDAAARFLSPEGDKLVPPADSADTSKRPPGAVAALDAGAAEPEVFDLSELESTAAQALPPDTLAVAAPGLADGGAVAEPAATMHTGVPSEVDCAAAEPSAGGECLDATPAMVIDADMYKQIGDLYISTPLYNVYLNEADEWSRQLITDLSEWALELDRPVPESAIARSHSLAGSSATVGFTALSELARAVEHALQRLQGQSHGTAEQARVLGAASEEVRRVLHQFAAGLLKLPDADVLAAVHALEPAEMTGAAAAVDAPPALARRADAAPAATAGNPASHVNTIGDGIDVRDAVDPDLFPIFEEEAEELLPQLSVSLRQWVTHPGDRDARGQVLRALHTLKGSARLAGALRLGEMAHRIESEIETIGADHVVTADLEPLLDHLDELTAGFRRLKAGEPAPGVEVLQAAPPADVPPAAAQASANADTTPPAAEATAMPVVRGEVALPATLSMVSARAAASQAVRVRSQLLDRLVVQAGEVVTSRARLETEIGQLRGSLSELTGNLERLRRQLRDVELQAETQMQSRLALAKDGEQNFDPLEFDRFTRMQELTRMMAESVNDVATVQRSLQRAVEASEDDLAVQARQARELQRDLLRTRMVEFEGVAERLYRVVRQAAKETDKQVRLDITGGSIEMDRGILDRMMPVFEHLLRNCVVHGIEPPAERAQRGKDVTGLVGIDVQQAGNDVSVEFRDDGGGLNLPRIRERALQLGLIQADQPLGDNEVANLVFAPGFTTVTEVTELAGRGIGMDVVRTEVQALGGRIETHTRDGQGARFRLVLPLTTAVTHVVMLRSGALVIGVPSKLVEIVRRATPAELQQAYDSGTYRFGDETLPFFWSGALLQSSPHSAEPPARTTPIIIFRSADQRVALHVDEVLGNQEVVVKALGPQLSRLPGLVAITALASGAVALIYNPVALAAVYGDQARALGVAGQPAAPQDATVAPHSDIPMVLVVDDSITVRRVTQRLLQREGYRVVLAADGLQGLEKLQGERPAVILSDIEMPRMDGFDFVRNLRADEHLRDLPVIMITSRIAEKHREHARKLGVNHYLGKPYSEEELLGLIKTYARAAVSATQAE